MATGNLPPALPISGAFTAAQLAAQNELTIKEHVQLLSIKDARAMLSSASWEIQSRKEEIEQLSQLKQTIKRELLGE